MKKIKAIALIMILVMLAGCGMGTAEEKVETNEEGVTTEDDIKNIYSADMDIEMLKPTVYQYTEENAGLPAYDDIVLYGERRAFR